MQNNENNEVKICTRCKREISYYDKTCYYCGEEFEVEYTDERAEYIQKNIGTYLRKFNKIDSGDKASSWNWCAFLFTVDWLVYRKMYKLAVIVNLFVRYAFTAEFFCGRECLRRKHVKTVYAVDAEPLGVKQKHRARRIID